MRDQKEISMHLHSRLDLEFLKPNPKTLINSLQAISQDFDTLFYLTLTLLRLFKTPLFPSGKAPTHIEAIDFFASQNP